MKKSSSTPEKKLKKYREKRDFKVTREPAGSKKKSNGRLFVIQKHHARRLHWDLRLETQGVLASWAVPKEPPKTLGVKRLAVHVEDHPLDYANFEGRIPEGEYGAGKVEIWDKGDYEAPEDISKQIKKGKVEFKLNGERLKGRYILVKMDGKEEKDKENWLFFRKEDYASDKAEAKSSEPGDLKGAKRAKTPATLSPMLCKHQNEPPEGDKWLREIKWDGYRVLAFSRGNKVTFKTRNDNIIKLPEIERVLEKEYLPEGVYDGELVAVDERGISNFKIAHADIAAKRTSDLIVYLFDLPFYNGWDLRDCALEDRKAILEQIVEQMGSEKVRYSAHSEGNGQKLYEDACATGLEGLISKRKGSAYSSVRSPNWVKTRCERQLEGWIGGFTPISSGEDAIGALLIGIKDDESRLLYVGKVGTGFTQAMREQLFDELSKNATEKPPFEPSKELPKKGVTWTKPKTPAVVQYLEWAEGGVMRQPKLASVGKPAKKETPKKSPSPKKSNGGSAANLSIKISSADRVVDPESGLTKGDVAVYYHTVAKLILPYLENRPLPVLRCPEGISGACFFHKHWIKGLPENVAKVDVEEDDGDKEDYMAIDDEKGLLALAQMSVVELHPWGSRMEHLEQPDILIFDLDPGEGMEWKEVVKAAHQVREELESIGLKSFAKLSGGKGVHAVVPIKPELEWDQAKSFCEAFAREMAKRYPDRYTAALPKAQRKGKIFLDYLRNGRGATAVTAYSLRARANLPVAMPVEWDEVRAKLLPNAFSLKAALKHIEKRKTDPWKNFFKKPGSLKKALRMQ